MRETKDSDERRQEFVDAAEKLFRENGIVDTTVNNIVKELNVAKGLFYYYFKSKDDVIDAISEKYAEAFNESMRKSMSTPDWSTRINQFTENCVLSFTELNKRLKGDSEGVDLSQLTMLSIEEARIASSRTLKNLLEEGNSNGMISVDNPEYYAELIVGGISYLVARGNTDAEEIKTIVNNLIKKTGKE